jgi:hypothetical protein
MVLSQGVLGTLSGTVLGAMLTFGITFLNQWQQSRKQRRIATMHVASNLRCWMREMSWRMEQTKLSVVSEGNAGTPYGEIPGFQFETSLATISLLPRTTAIKLFGLIHEKDATNISINWCIELEDADDAIDLFRSRSAKLFLDAAALCNRMSRQVGWPDEEVFDRYVTMMRSEIQGRVKTNKPAGPRLRAVDSGSCMLNL